MSGGCNVYDLEFDAQIPYQKITWMDFGKSGHPGEGLDVDQNPATCAPAGNCSAGIDNSFSSFLASLVSFGIVPTNPFDSVIQSGDLILLAEPLGWNNWGTSFSMGFYTGDVLQSGGSTCNFQTAYCNYHVQAESINPQTCLPYIFFYPVVMNAGVLSGGGPQSHFEIAMDFIGGIPLTLRFYMARIHAETIVTSSGKVKIDKGIIGGAIATQELFDAILALPPGTLPMDPVMVVNLLSGMLVKDMDINGDGVKDAASVSLKFKSIEGKILGVH
jgi:hypothetical protein